MASLALERVSKRFPNGHAAVEELSLDIADGELLVLVGPSGCGKSTVLRLIAGLEAPTSGRIAIDGTDVTDVPPQQRDLAMVFQSYALYPHKTVRENLAFGLRMRGTAPAEIADRVARVAASLDIEALLDRRRRSSPAASASASRSAAPSSASHARSCSTSRSPTWIRCSVPIPGRSWGCSIAAWERRWSTSRTIKRRR